MDPRVPPSSPKAPSSARGAFFFIDDPREEQDRLFVLGLDLLSVAGKDGYFKRVNPAFVETLGWSEDELLAAPFLSWVHPDDLAATRERLAGLGEGRAASTFVNRYRCRDGGYRWLSWRTRAEGELLYSVCRDVSESVAREEASERQLAQLEMLNARFKGVLDSSPDAIVVLEAVHGPAGVIADFRIVLGNQAAARLVGKASAKELEGSSYGQTHASARADGLLDMYCRVVEKGSPEELERVYSIEGAVRWVHFAAVKVDDGAVVTASDVTARRQAEARVAAQMEELRLVNVYKDQFLGVVSHELRTPINAIMGFGSVLLDGLLGPVSSEQRGCLEKLLEASDTLLRLVSDLLDVGRMQAGEFTLRPRPMDFAAVAREALERVAPEAARREIVCRDSVGVNLPRVLGDRERVAQVLAHLLSNALKFTPPGGQVTLGASLRGHELRCEVMDTGPGIDARDQAKLFMRFSQVDMTTTRAYGGMGLGLSIVKGLVEAHGGQVGVSSEPGHGATFWFTLPLTPE